MEAKHEVSSFAKMVISPVLINLKTNIVMTKKVIIKAAVTQEYVKAWKSLHAAERYNVVWVNDEKRLSCI